MICYSFGILFQDLEKIWNGGVVLQICVHIFYIFTYLCCFILNLTKIWRMIVHRTVVKFEKLVKNEKFQHFGAFRSFFLLLFRKKALFLALKALFFWFQKRFLQLHFFSRVEAHFETIIIFANLLAFLYTFSAFLIQL